MLKKLQRNLLCLGIHHSMSVALDWPQSNCFPPFHFIEVGGRHIHHLVFGIIILLLVGYGWLAEIGNGADSSSIFVGRLMSVLYGVGAALTLDEFALWLNLRDVYWEREGRESIDAILLFSAVLSISIFGGRFFHAVANELILHRKK